MNQVCACSCGKSSVTISENPISRFVCHCLNCQKHTGLPVSDDCAFLFSSVIFPQVNSIEYSKRNSFVSLQRGKCSFCGSPVVSVFSFFKFLKFVFVPSKNIPAVLSLPKIEAHTFFHRRVSKVNDAAPKYYGYWSSQYNTARILLAALLKNKNA
jgi:hypothetical protein